MDQSPADDRKESEAAWAGDLRRSRRAPANLLGRYRLAGRMEYPCQTRDLSAGGAALYAPVAGRPGDRLVLRLDKVGRLEGRIVRLMPNGFAVEFVKRRARPPTPSAPTDANAPTDERLA